MSEPIAFIASVYKVQTLVDGGIQVTLELPETAIMQAAMLMECKRLGIALDISCKTVESKSTKDHDMGKGAKRKSKWTASQESDLDKDT